MPVTENASENEVNGESNEGEETPIARPAAQNKPSKDEDEDEDDDEEEDGK